MNTNDTLIICIDLQEKLVNMLSNSECIANNAQKLMKAASILNIDTVITEQYPKGLGPTIDTIKSIKDFRTIEKTSFSALKTREFSDEFNKINPKTVVIFGIETHICVYQTVLDLIKKGCEVFVAKDCCGSRSILNYETSLELMKEAGAKITTLEILLFDFLQSSKHPNFKEIQALIK